MMGLFLSLNQPRPDVNGSFIEFKEFKPIEPEFPWKYYESQVSKFLFFRNGFLDIHENNVRIGIISNVLDGYESRYFFITKGLMAFKWSADTEFKSTQTAPLVTNLIYANGKISIYYENILSEISENKKLGIQGIFQCETERNLR
ncbi:unnamed protein product [Schistosoma haematobium]|nr:unnamed protein product [Schistosoma haematobium]